MVAFKNSVATKRQTVQTHGRFLGAHLWQERYRIIVYHRVCKAAILVVFTECVHGIECV